MKSKKNKINLGTKTRKFYDSFVSFLFDRFNKPKKINQKGGAKTANEIKMDFITDIRNNGPGTKERIETVAKSILNKKYKNLKDAGYSFICPPLKVSGRDTPFSRYVYRNENTISDSDVASLALFYKDSAPITDEELVTLVPDVVAPVAAPASMVAPVVDATPLYLNFRNEIKTAIAGKPCNDDTIEAAGKEILKTDSKYELLHKYYEFDTSMFLTGGFLTWFCGDDAAAPPGGFPRMFIPNGKANVQQMTPEILVNLVTNKQDIYSATVPEVATTATVGELAKPMQETSTLSTTGSALGVGAAVGAAGLAYKVRKAWAKGTAPEETTEPGETTEQAATSEQAATEPGETTEGETTTATVTTEPGETTEGETTTATVTTEQATPGEATTAAAPTTKPVKAAVKSQRTVNVSSSQHFSPVNGSSSQPFLPDNVNSSGVVLYKSPPQPISNGALGLGVSGDVALAVSAIGAVGLFAYFLLKGKKNKSADASDTASIVAPHVIPPASIVAPHVIPSTTEADANGLEAEAEQQRQLEADQKRQLEEQKRQKREDKIQKDVDKFIKADYKCGTIVHQADNYLRSIEKDYVRAQKSYSKLKNTIITHIKGKCGDDIDMGVLQNFSSEQSADKLASEPDLPKSSGTNFAPQSSSMASPSRSSPPLRLTSIPSHLSRIDSNGSEDEISTGFSWRQGNPQRPDETAKNKE